MSIKQELRKYYAKQGLTGKHLRKALQWDMKAVTRNKRTNVNPPRGPGLLKAFGWHGTPEGSDYWCQRSLGTGK